MLLTCFYIHVYAIICQLSHDDRPHCLWQPEQAPLRLIRLYKCSGYGSCIEGFVTSYSTLLSGESDLFDITTYLHVMEKSHIYHLGVVLGIRQTKLKALKDSDTFLDDVISAWLRKEDQVTEKGDPSWTVLVNALKDARVGQLGISDKIAKDKGGLCDNTYNFHKCSHASVGLAQACPNYYMSGSGISLLLHEELMVDPRAKPECQH